MLPPTSHNSDIARAHANNAATYPNAPQYGARAPTTGVDATLGTYTLCEHEQADSTSSTNSILRCGRRAIMMPGYHRACAEHILHALRRSVAEYANRPASVYDDPRTQTALLELLTTLAECITATNHTTNT
jgi:hypothetical protein